MSGTSPYAAPVSDASLELQEFGGINLRELACRQRCLNMTILTYLLFLTVCIPCILVFEDNLFVMIPCGLVSYSILIYGCFCAYKLTRFLYSRVVSWILLVAMFLPGFGLILLLFVNQKLSSILKKSGYTVGILGCKIGDQG